MAAAGATIVENFNLWPMYKQLLSPGDLVRSGTGALTNATVRQGGSGLVLIDGAYENVQASHGATLEQP